jgi:UDP-glucose 4-epimerase
LVERLIADGNLVIAIDRCPAPDQFAGSDKIVWIERDLAQNGLDAKEVADANTVYHLAGATLGAGQDEWQFLIANEATTVRLLQACASHVSKFIFSSSQVVYGDADHLAVTEDFPLQGTSSAYACSKLNSENWLRWFQKKYGGQYLSLRFSGFVEGGGAVDYMVERALCNDPIELFSQGKVNRDYLPVEKGIEAFILANRFESEMGFEVFNIGSGQAVSSLQMAELICSEAASSSEIILSMRSAPQENFVFDISKAAKRLGFDPGSLSGSVQAYVRRRMLSEKKRGGYAQN